MVLIGPSGCGKSTFARTHFGPFETLSSDFCRGLVSNDENDQGATKAAFEVLHTIAAKRLEAGLLTVVDATNVQPESRKPLVELARRYHMLPVAIVLDMPERVCEERNRARADRTFGGHVIRQQRGQLHKSLRNLQREGFRHLHVLRTPEDVARVTIERQPLWNNRKGDRGPFDIIGDVHGCADELEALLQALGYARDALGVFAHADGRKVVFVGDLVDRGPRVSDTLRIAMTMANAGTALAVPGQSRSQARQGAARARRTGEARSGRDARAARTGDAGVSRAGRRLPRRTRESLRAGRREARGGARRDEGGDAGPRVGESARLRPVRRNHRRDGRIRAARSATTGLRNIVVLRTWYTVTRRSPSPSG